MNQENPKWGMWRRNFFWTTGLDQTHGPLEIIKLYDIKEIFSLWKEDVKEPVHKSLI